MTERAIATRTPPRPRQCAREREPVIIIGAGPTGLASAALLADYGVASTILERWPGVYPQPRAVHLDDEVYRILGRVGLADEFAAISRPSLGLRLVTRDLAALAEFQRTDTTGPHGYPTASMYDQPALEQILRTAVERRSDLIDLVSGVEVESIVQHHDRVSVIAADRQTGAHIAFSGSYLLGCDGAGGRTRASIRSSWKDMGFTQRWLVIDIDCAQELPYWEGVYQVCDSRRAATYMRVGSTRYRWEFQLHDGECAADFPDLVALGPLLAPWLKDISLDELTLVRCAEYTFRARIAERWRDRRIFLLGDAAHLTPPFIGQGLGSGLRDAANLSWKLAAVLNAGASTETLDSYQAERAPHAASLIRRAIAVGVAMTGGGRGGDAARSALAPLVGRLGPAVSRLTDSTTPRLSSSYYVRTRVRPMAIARTAGRVHRVLPGSLAPNAVVSSSGKRLDDYLGSFVLIAAGSVAKEIRYEVARRGARVVEVDVQSLLGRWLTDGGARAAVVRPDATVLVAGASASKVYTMIPAMIPAKAPGDDLVTTAPECCTTR